MHLLKSNLIFFFNDTATTEIYTLSLHDALPISEQSKKDTVVENMSTEYETYPITIEKIGMQVNITN